MQIPLMAMMPQQEPPRKTPLDVFMIPEHRVLEFLERMDAAEQPTEQLPFDPDNPDYRIALPYRQLEFRRWVFEEFPLCRDQSMTIYVDQILAPSVWLYGPLKPLTAGRKFSIVHVVPPELEHRTLVDLCMAELEYPSSRVSRYNLWNRLSQTFPDIRQGSWKVYPRVDRIWVVKTAPAALEEEDDE